MHNKLMDKRMAVVKGKETELQPGLEPACMGLPNSGHMLLPLSYWSSGIGAEIDTIQFQPDLRSRLLLRRAPIL